MDLNDLAKPFPPERVSWRVGSVMKDGSKGMALAYIDARDVQDRLDAVCGIGGWQCRYALQGTTTICEIGIRIDSEWIWKSDGAGATDVEGEKGALSDAFKRAGVKWGVGRYLYDLDSPWVEIEQRGKTSIIKKTEYAKLRSLLAGNAAPVPTPTPPPPPAPNPAAKERAIQWANDALKLLQTMKDQDFEAWHKANADKIAAIQKHDEKLHKQLAGSVMAKRRHIEMNDPANLLGAG